MVATPSVDNSEWVMQGVIRDPQTGALLRVNADGSINVSGGAAGGGVGTGTTITGAASITLNSTGILFNGAALGGTGFTSATTAGTAVVGSLGTNGLSVGVPAYLTTADLSQNSSLYAGTGFSGTGVSGTVNSNGVQLSVPLGATISSYENFVPGNFVAQTLNGASVSAAAAFQMPQRGSFSFIRIPVLMTTNSTTLATTGASMSASVAQYTTFNAVVYSLGTGANSQSLQSVASGSAGFTNMNSISVAANGTQYTITQIMTFPALGFNTSTQSTAYSISNTNYSFSSAIQTVFSTERFLDIPFAVSLSAGPYWLIIGYSSSSATNSTGVSAASNANVFYSQHHAQSVVNVAAWGIMGSTNIASGAGLGMGSFSTVGGGTTASLPISAISSSQSHARFYFQMLRSA